jgi:hypothetical protein
MPPVNDLELPTTIRIGQIAIAAGLAGHSVTLVYHGFPSPLLAEVWKYFAGKVGKWQVIYVESGRDLRQLAPTSDEPVENSPKIPRLVFVRDDRLLGRIGWATELGQAGAAKKGVIRPAVFAIANSQDTDDAPGARLDLYASPKEEQAILAWRQRTKEEERVAQPEEVPPSPVRSGVPNADAPFIRVTFPKSIEELRWPKSPRSDAPGLHRLRDCQVLWALVAGDCVLRAQHSGATPAAALEATADDYEAVYTLLTSAVARPADEPLDLLAAALVARANVYLKMLHQKTELQLARQEEGNGGVDRRRQITRHDLVDLGKPRSKANRELIKFLLGRPDGYAMFCKLGLIRNVSEADWQKAKAQLEAQKRWPAPKQGKAETPVPEPVASLTSSLRSWSYKQIRTHFDRLVRDEFITAERPLRNGPWKYTLPEQLTSRSAFHNLPSPATIRTALAAGSNTSAPPTACPTCPRSAQPAGQTEVEQKQPITSPEGSIAPIPEV